MQGTRDQKTKITQKLRDYGRQQVGIWVGCTQILKRLRVVDTAKMLSLR